MAILFFLIWVVLAFGVGCLGYRRKIGFWFAFVIALLNVVIGLIAVLCSKDKIDFIGINKEGKV